MYYTGLTNWNLLLMAIQLYNLSVYIIVASCPLFSNCIVMTLKRLHLGLSGQDLGYWLVIHFCHWFTLPMSRTLDNMTMQTGIFRKTLPVDFSKHYCNCTVIINCFRIFIYRPSDLAIMQTYSCKKLQNSVNCFVRLTHKGVVRYISNGWVVPND